MGHGVRSDQEAARTSIRGTQSHQQAAPASLACRRDDHQRWDQTCSQLQAGLPVERSGGVAWFACSARASAVTGVTSSEVLASRTERPAVHMSTRLLPVFELQGGTTGG